VKQGCPLNPLLFRLYIDALDSRIAALAGDDGPDLAGTAVKLLLYADDSLNVQVAAGTPKAAWWAQRFLQGTGLDCERENDQGRCLWEQSELVPIALWWITCWGGCILPLSRNWVAPKRVIEDIVEHLAAVGQRAVFALRRRCADLKINDPAIMCQLFDALVKLVLSYGCELWVNEPATKSLEVIHRSFLKSLLSVNDTTPSRIVLAEFGRFPLILLWRQQALKYKARMSTSLPSRLMSLAYSVQQALLSRQKCWFRKLQNWDSEGDIQPSSQVPPSMASMQQIFLDCSGGGNRLANYFRLYGNSAYGFQAYLSLVDNVQLRKCLSRFCCSNHCLEIETGRRTKPLKTPICERLCKQCSLGAVENEDHFMLVCPAYEHIRDKFRHHLPIGPITSIQELVSCQNQSTLASFIEQCLQIRT
jgi:hypothetical protein